MNRILLYLASASAIVAGNVSAAVPQSSVPRAIVVDYPSHGSIFAPDFIPPLFQWRDSSAAAVWRIQIRFGAETPKIEFWSAGEKMQIGELDNSLVGYVPPTLTPEQAEAHTWRPDEKVWKTIKAHSARQRATVAISGYTSRDAPEPVSVGQMEIQTSTDPVGAPILYRDVPLLPATKEQIERGVIKPLPDSVLPDIKWELRYTSALKSKVVRQALPTCANCHSISRDGITLGIDVDSDRKRDCSESRGQHPRVCKYCCRRIGANRRAGD